MTLLAKADSTLLKRIITDDRPMNTDKLANEMQHIVLQYEQVILPKNARIFNI